MKYGPKTKQWLALKKLPEQQRALVKIQLDTLEEVAAGHGRSAAQQAIEGIKGVLQAALDALYEQAQNIIAALPDMIHETFTRMAQEKLDSLPQIKGDPGYTPVKGKDYFDGEPGAPGVTPVKDKDYPSTEKLAGMISTAHKELYEKIEKEGYSAKQVKAAMVAAIKGLDFATIARGLEALTGKARLSYTALKDTPAKEVKPVHGQHTLHRGGGTGKQTYYYDLSDLCDGVTKAFAIPANTRVVAVSGTDAPGGVYRPLVDWTGTGTTLLTLTGQVAAPGVGATLYILYVQ